MTEFGGRAEDGKELPKKVCIQLKLIIASIQQLEQTLCHYNTSIGGITFITGAPNQFRLHRTGIIISHLTCRIEVYKVGDGVLLIGEGGGAGSPGPSPRQGASHAPRAAPSYGQRVRALPGLLPHPQCVQTRQRPATVAVNQIIVQLN